MAIESSHSSQRVIVVRSSGKATAKQCVLVQSRRLNTQMQRIRAKVQRKAQCTRRASSLTPPPEATPLPVTSSSTIRLPPPVVNRANIMKNIADASSDLAGVNDQFVRDHLAAFSPEMLRGVVSIRANCSRTSLPETMEISLPASVDSVNARPTHMLALRRRGERKITLFPAHHLVLAAHCANLPQFAPSSVATASSVYTIPVQQMCLPFPEVYGLLHAYLYTKNASSLAAILGNRNAIMAVYWNARALGVVDDELYGFLDAAVDAIVAA